MANEMLLAAARRGELGNTPEQVMARLVAFYTQQGFPIAEATRQASAAASSILGEIAARRQAGDIQSRALQVVRENQERRVRAEQQWNYRQNPRLLGEGAASPARAEMPGYDPTGYLFQYFAGEDGRDHSDTANMLPRMSVPMTDVEAREMRVTRPRPRGDLPGWRIPAAPVDPMAAGEPRWRRIMGRVGLGGSGDRQVAQTYAPAGEGAPILNSGEQPTPPSTATLGQIALRSLNPFYRWPQPTTVVGSGGASQPSATAPAPQFMNNNMSAAFLEGPAEPQIRPMDSTLFGEDAGPRPSPMIASDSTLAGYDMPPAARAAVRTARNVMPQNPPMPPPRPRDEAPARGRFFSGPDYQSMNALAEGPERGYGAPVLQNGRINWGDSENPADFVRADAAMRAGRAEGGGLDPMGGLMPPDMATMPVDAPEMPMPPMPPEPAPPSLMDGPKAPAAGGGAGGRDAAINKALDIIHNLVNRQRI